MRLVLACSLIVGLGACSTDPDVALVHRATLDAEALGLALADGGDAAWLGMADQLCVVEVADGGVSHEVDPEPGQEVLLDAHAGRALAGTASGVVEVDLDGQVRQVTDRPVRAARLLADGGLVVVVEHEGSCAVASAQGSFALPGTQCGEAVDLAVDRVRGTAWIADGSALTIVEPDGRFVRFDDQDVDRVRFDRVTGHVLVGARGGQTVSEIAADGSVVWQSELEGPLVSLDVAGGAGMAAVLVEDGERGSLRLLDTQDGRAMARHPLPETAEVVTSDDGRSLALVTGNGTQLYTVEGDRGHFALPGTERAEGVNPWTGLAASVGAAGAVGGVGIALGSLLLVD